MSVPYYVIPNNTDAEEWYKDKGIAMQRDHGNYLEDAEDFEEVIEDNIEDSDGRNGAHLAAMEEDLVALQQMAESEDDEVFNYADTNGWTPLHEAARTLNLDIVKFIIEQGADVNARTLDESTAYDLAVAHGGESHPTSKYLQGFLVDDDIDEAEQEL